MANIAARGPLITDLPPDARITAADLAQYLSTDGITVAKTTVDKWRRIDRGPAFIPVGDGPKPRIYYRVSDVNAWWSNTSTQGETQDVA